MEIYVLILKLLGWFVWLWLLATGSWALITGWLVVGSIVSVYMIHISFDPEKRAQHGVMQPLLDPVPLFFAYVNTTIIWPFFLIMHLTDKRRK